MDTSVVFPHKMGPPYKRALRNLTSEHLQRIIQEDGKKYVAKSICAFFTSEASEKNVANRLKFQFSSVTSIINCDFIIRFINTFVFVALVHSHQYFLIMLGYYRKIAHISDAYIKNIFPAYNRDSTK